MAEKESYSRPPRRGAHSYRGRGGHVDQNRLYQLGVTDLREILDRKRSERGYAGDTNIPPDPSYNYLKDPLRENIDNISQEHPSRHPSTYTRKHYKNGPNDYHKRDRAHQSGNISNQSTNKDIENPLNIKVEFSTATGEHTYKMDESTVLPTIKHVPDRLPHQNRSFRGRGRGRGRGQQRSYQTRTIRNNASNKKLDTKDVSTNQYLPPLEPPPVVADVEENWDDELDHNKESGDTEGCEQGTGDYGSQEELLFSSEEQDKEEEALEEDLQNLKIEVSEVSDQTDQKLEDNQAEKSN